MRFLHSTLVMADILPPSPKRGISQWFGSGALVALAVLLAGRFAAEKLRGMPHFDDRGGMDAYGAVETYYLKKNPNPIEVACFGTSQSVFGISEREVATCLGEKAECVRNLGTPGGTPFDMWSLVRRNPDSFKDLHLAVVEINPFVLQKGLEGDDRMVLSLSQKANLHERLTIASAPMRRRQLMDLVLPLYSARRSLRTVFLNVLDPCPGNALCPCPEQKALPAAGWVVNHAHRYNRERQKVSPDMVARRFFGNWRVSALQDQSLRHLLAWLHDHKVPVVLHQMPVHPDVVKLVKSDPRYSKGFQQFSDYVASLKPAPAAVIQILDTHECGAGEGDLADRTHLNQLGAGIYSRYLAEKIKAVPGLGVAGAHGG